MRLLIVKMDVFRIANLQRAWEHVHRKINIIPVQDLESAEKVINT